MTRGIDEGGVRCANGGECIDGLGEEFTCVCQEGWTGELCEENIDECQENPCQNDGHCMDLVGDYQCVCPLTWTGRQCEERVEQCEDNPCLNDALCLIEDDAFRCYCVPDYHGSRCQFRYDECRLPPGPKCLHSGLCMDEVDGFQCQCKDGFSGDQCECSGAEEDLSCLDVNTTLSWTIPPDYLPDMDDSTDLDTATDTYTSVHVVGVDVTVGYEEVSYITADMEEIHPTPSIDMGEDSTLDDTDLVSTTIVSISDGVTMETTPALPDGVTADEEERTGNIPEDGLIIDTITTEDTNANNTTTETHETATETISDVESTTGYTMKVTTLSPTDSQTTDVEDGISSCSRNVCKNGGTCLTSIDGFQCHCRLQYSGRHCEQEVAVQTPGRDL